MTANTHDAIVIGAGSAGLTAAGGLAMFGLKVALIEAGPMGGDCLNSGCVPSKALIAAAARAHEIARPDRLGIASAPPRVDFANVRDHVRASIAAIAPNDSQERFEAMGVEVIRARAHFVDRRTVSAGERRLRAPRIVIATGSRPRVPPIAGLDRVAFLTNETIFDLDECPRHLLIVGGGPIGIELAQAFRRLGAEVTVLARGLLLSRDDRDAAAIVAAQLHAEGVTIVEHVEISATKNEPDGVLLESKEGRTFSGSHLLVATGRAPNVEDLGLAEAGVRVGDGGIIVDSRCRTSNRRIRAIGDCRAGPRFTHVSGHEGTVAALGIALGLAAKPDYRALPWVTYSDPELGQVGLTEAAAREKFGEVEAFQEAFADNDRAVTEGEIDGFLKIVRARRRIVGVTTVGRHAGDLLAPWCMIVGRKTSAFDLAGMILPYPTRSELSKAAAFSSYEGLVFSRWTKGWARLLARLRRMM